LRFKKFEMCAGSSPPLYSRFSSAVFTDLPVSSQGE
jgi:hypothetical protein